MLVVSNINIIQNVQEQLLMIQTAFHLDVTVYYNFLLIQKSLDRLQKRGLTALEQIADPPCLKLCQRLIPDIPE